MVAIFISLLPLYYYLYLQPKPIKQINNDLNITKILKTIKIKELNTTIISNKPQETKKPKLMIIMDDLATIKEAKALKSLPFHVVPSIFPKTPTHPNTPKMAKMFKSIMMHLPMEAINNHTGSLFTSKYKSFYESIKILKDKGIFFIDSKTTTKSKYIEVSKKLQQKIFQRDIFLDNKLEVSYIKSQLKKAVKIAKAKGFAIAICHPKKETFKALRQSKQLLKNIKLVGIDEL